MKTSSRFVIGRRLGEGGMGLVHEAFDLERQERVALKSLPAVDGAAVYQLKREFRTLTNVAHPNLVSLYELVCEDGNWFFTMELVEGVSFLDYVRPGAEDTGDRSVESGGPPSGELDEERLQGALRQLAEGLLALHGAGKVHRDVKSSNVLVARNGRVVILDFGISVDQHRDSRQTKTRGWGSGSLHYMSPEQIGGEPVSPAGDWYSAGVMLYEALTGSLPFEGSAINLIYRKLNEDAPPVRDSAPTAPADLARLCDALLSREPSHRPDSVAVLKLLGVDEPGAPSADWAPEGREIVGREAHIRELEDALRTTREGQPVTVYLYCPSGIGKSRIVEEFLSGVALDRTAVVLRGQCYDRESVPYNAFDGLIDSLSHYLRTLPRSEVKGLLPHDIHILARLFPVLLRVKGIPEEARGVFDHPQPIELRRRAVLALRELFARIAAVAPLVLHVDDWHWSDADSVALGGDLLRGRDAPQLLLIVGFRSEEIPFKPFLKASLEEATIPTRRELAVGPLTPGECEKLVDSLLPSAKRPSRRFRGAIVQEAAGSPFLIEQLCRHVRDDDVRGAVAPGLSDMLDARAKRLPSGSRELLQTLAVTGRPIDFAVAHRAAGRERPATEVRALVTALRVAQMIRPTGRTDTIELYHDRIREEVAERVMPAEVIRIHRRLAEVLEEVEEADPEALFEHYRGAGDAARAGSQAARAAKRASGALAFDRAVTLYSQAIDIGSPDVADVVAWQEGLGDALAASGRPGDAARAYLAAGQMASKTKAMDLRRSAAEHFLIGGHIEQGLEVTGALMNEVGLWMPKSSGLVVVSLLLRRLQIWMRGVHYELRSQDDDQRLQLLRLDICLSCALGLALTDYIVAAYFQARYLLLALDAGETRRLARAFSFEGGFVAARGGPAEARAARFVKLAQDLAEQVGTPRERGMAAVTAGSAASMQGRFVLAVDLCEHAEKILREQCTGVHGELTTCLVFHTTALIYLGWTAELVTMLPELIESAEKRGSLFEGVELRTHPNMFWLVKDDPDEARRQLAEAMSLWDRRRFYRQEWLWLSAATEIDLYVGASSVAWGRLEQHLRALRRSQLLRVQFLRIEHLNLRGRAAVASAAQGHSPKARLRDAERIAKRIERERMPWSTPFAPLLRAGIASVRGDMDIARELLARSIAGFESADVGLYANVARRRLGEVLGGDEGGQLICDADTTMRNQAIEAPARFAAMLVPGVYG